MSTELQLMGVKCNLQCDFCYQDPQRLAGNENPTAEYDLEKVKAALLADRSNSFAFFGGEPLLTPINDLQHLMEFGRQHGKQMSVQTNATLITDRHIELFKQFNISIGVSLDGPGELNDARQAMDVRATRATTEKSQAALERLLAEGLSVSLIVTLCSTNADSPEKLAQLVVWLKGLQRLGLRYVNLHPLEVDTARGAALKLTEEASINAMRTLRRELIGFYVSPFEDMKKALLGEDGANCVWNSCDPYTTAAVQGINGQGQKANCGRTNKDGVPYIKANSPNYVRQLALYLTPQQYEGCAECRFFVACRGECPGTGESGDWRNRTAHCSMIKALLGDIEAELIQAGKQPLSLSLDRGRIESALLKAWESGQNLPVSAVVRNMHTNLGQNRPHTDIPHLDHNDHINPIVTHGDSTR